jgi:UPF0271 protein
VLKQLGEFLEGKVTTCNQLVLPIKADTICLHSDTEGAVDLAKIIYDFLIQHDVEITAD